MTKVNIFEAKAKLSEYVDRAVKGEHIVICKRNRPVAELRRVEATRTSPRPIGALETPFEVPASFFDALPDEAIDPFYPDGEHEGGQTRVAEAGEHHAPRSAGARRSRPRRRR
jgi:prevent-host-death family protein